MKLTKKIKAFTLSELLVVLIISSIVISLAFLILSMVQKQVATIQKNVNIKQQIQFIDRMLWKDFNQYSVSYNDKEDKLICTSPIDSLTYKFYDTFVLRNKDTLPIEILNKTLFLDGKEVSSGVIDAIQLETPPVFGNTEIFIFKSKDASFYINN